MNYSTTVNIVLSGRFWKFNLIEGSFPKVNEPILSNPQMLVDFCNEHGIRVKNKSTLVDFYSNQLKY